MKTLVLTAYDSTMAPIGDLTAPLMLAYANRHGFDFHCSRQFDVGCESYWQKVWDIRAFTSLSNPIRKDYDRILWLDADQVITNPDWIPPWDKGAHFSLDWGIDAVDDNCFSACGFVVCRDAFGIFSSVAERHYLYREKEFPEQAALRGIRQSLSREREMMFIHDRRVFNAVPVEICTEAPDPWQKGDFCAHLTHVSVERRVEIFHAIQNQLKPIITMDTKEQLISEREALDTRIAAIDEQMASAEYVTLPGEDTERIKLQRELMLKYSEVLGERIRVYDAERMQKDEDKGEGDNP